MSRDAKDFLAIRRKVRALELAGKLVMRSLLVTVFVEAEQIIYFGVHYHDPVLRVVPWCVLADCMIVLCYVLLKGKQLRLQAKLPEGAQGGAGKEEVKH